MPVKILLVTTSRSYGSCAMYKLFKVTSIRLDTDPDKKSQSYAELAHFIKPPFKFYRGLMDNRFIVSRPQPQVGIWAALRLAVIAAGVSAFISPLAHAQSATSTATKSSATASHSSAQFQPDDLSGVWLIDRMRSNSMPSPNNRDPSKPLTLIDGTVIPLRPEFEKIYRERSKYDETDQPYAGMSSRCLPPGTPFNMMGPPYPIHIVQQPDFIAMLLEESWTFRAIYMNEKHPDQLVPGFMGHSVGHWEGKTLVIETVGIRDDVPLTGGALTHSLQLRLIERLTREGPDLLVDRIEVNDPINFYKPFTFISYFNRTKQQQIEYICEVNNIQVSPEGRQIYQDVK